MGLCTSSNAPPPSAAALSCGMTEGSGEGTDLPSPLESVARPPPPRPSYPTILSRSAVPNDRPLPRPEELAQLAIDGDATAFDDRFGAGTGAKAITYMKHLSAFPTNARKQFDNVRLCVPLRGGAAVRRALRRLLDRSRSPPPPRRAPPPARVLTLCSPLTPRRWRAAVGARMRGRCPRGARKNKECKERGGRHCEAGLRSAHAAQHARHVRPY